MLLLVAALILYLSFQSISLDDFDSGSFALALDHFDIGLQQPHPPGFPVYIATGRLLYAITANRVLSLTLLSAISGAIAIGALAWLGAEAGQRRAGLLAALWLMVVPIFWLTSEIALSDIPGVALVLLAVVGLWKGRADPRWLMIGAGLAGLCLGLRPQNGIPIVVFGLYTCVAQIKRARHDAPLRVIGLAVVIGLIAVLLWLIPTISASGGWEAYWSLVRAHSNHIIQIDSLVGPPIDGAAITARIDAFARGLLALVGDHRLGMITLVTVTIGLFRVRWRLAFARLCALWLVLVAAQVFLFESLERPRLYLPFIPPLALLAAMGWTRLVSLTNQKGASRRAPTWIIPLIMALLFALTSLPLAAKLSREAAPPVQATQYITAYYPADHSLVVMIGSLRAAQIGLPDYPQLYLGQFDAAQWAKVMADRQPTYLILMDRDDVWSEAYSALTSSGDYIPVEDKVFARDPRVFPQHSLTRLQVLTPIHLLSPEQLALPDSGEIRVGADASGKYFGEGWYRAEDIGGSLARWTQQTATLRVALPPANTRLTIEVAPYPADQTVEVIVNGQSIGTLYLRDTWQPLTLTIPAVALTGHPISTITLRHAHADTPPGSNRTLAAAYRVIRFLP
ncbi:MAG: DUF2723 domain-containing protein [Anaerolineae bacterium]|nr:DUF2723 domain-containing protein [Anaerolineae bacterium]